MLEVMLKLQISKRMNGDKMRVKKILTSTITS
jgi:hypothetical protein